MTWVLVGHLVLAVVFGSAAMLKARAFWAFADDLRIPFRGASTGVAAAVIGGEALLAVGLFTFVGEPRVLAAASRFVVFATLFIALRLILTDETECGCWGRSRTSGGHAYIGWQDNPRQSFSDVLRSAGYGLRNGTVLLMMWIFMQSSGRFSHEYGMINAMIASFISTIIIGIGLIISVIHRVRQLNLPDNPLKEMLASRLAPLVALSCHMGDTSSDGCSLLKNSSGTPFDRRRRHAETSLRFEPRPAARSKLDGWVEFCLFSTCWMDCETR